MRGLMRRVLLATSAIVGCLLMFGAGSALAVDVLTASGGAETGPLRDNLTTPPSNGNYGADLLASNTRAVLAWTIAGAVAQKNATNYVSVGIKLNSNPEAIKPGCHAATGYVQFADFQKRENSGGANSPLYADTQTPWRVTINSITGCTQPGKVTIESVGLFEPALGNEYTGTITGVAEQPGASCAAGGVKLDLSQPLMLINGSKPPPELGFSNGAGGNAFLCFTSADSYVYPKEPKGPAALTGSITEN